MSDHLVPAGGTVLGGQVQLGSGALLEDVSPWRMTLRMASQAPLPCLLSAP